MKTLGNIIWVVFGGFFIFLEYLFAGLLLCVTIVGIPFGLQAFKLAHMALWPFGKRIEYMDYAPGCLSTFMNILVAHTRRYLDCTFASCVRAYYLP